MTTDENTTIPVKREKNGSVHCTVTFTEEQVKASEEKAIKTMGEKVKIDGFRPGKAPAESIRQKLDPEQLINETIRGLLPETIEKVVTENKIFPITPPKIDVESMVPMKIKITFFEKPEVKLKNQDKITVKTEEPKIEEKDIDQLVQYVLKQHQKSEDKDGAAEKGDRVTMDFWGETLDGKEVEAIRTTNHQAVIGSKVLLPGFEDELIGLKAGDKKDFTITFPEKHQAEELQGKPVSFHVTVLKIETVTVPELTDDFVKQNMQTPSVDEFRKQVKESMVAQEVQSAKRKYEEEALEKIREATQVNLAEELIDDELEALTKDLDQQLKKQNLSFDEWAKQSGKNEEEMHKELRVQAEKRLTLRLGLAKIVEERNIEVSDEEMKKTIESFLQSVPEEQRKEVAKAYEKGKQGYDQVLWQKKVEKVFDQIIK